MEGSQDKIQTLCQGQEMDKIDSSLQSAVLQKREDQLSRGDQPKVANQPLAADQPSRDDQLSREDQPKVADLFKKDLLGNLTRQSVEVGSTETLCVPKYESLCQRDFL